MAPPRQESRLSTGSRAGVPDGRAISDIRMVEQYCLSGVLHYEGPVGVPREVGHSAGLHDQRVSSGPFRPRDAGRTQGTTQLFVRPPERADRDGGTSVVVREERPRALLTKPIQPTVHEPCRMGVLCREVALRAHRLPLLGDPAQDCVHQARCSRALELLYHGDRGLYRCIGRYPVEVQ